MAQEIYIEPGNLSPHVLKKAKNNLETANDSLASMSRCPLYQGPEDGYLPLYPSGLMDELFSLKDQLNELEVKLEKYSAIINSGPDEFAEIDSSYKNELTNWWGRTTYSADCFFTRIHGKTIMSEFWDDFGWAGVLAGTNWIKKLYGIGKDFTKASSWDDYIGTGRKVGEFLMDAGETYNNYMKIGRAVGTDKAMWWMFKKVTGLKPLGRVSVAKSPSARFINNLTNKTSPFNIKAQFKSFGEELVGKKGVGNAVASWTRVAATGAANYFSNKEEMAASDGEMSKDRMIAETAMETVVDIALEVSAQVIVGAAVSAVIGPVAAPALLITAVSGAVVSLTNVAVKEFTGETLTENISDGILNFGESILGFG